MKVLVECEPPILADVVRLAVARTSGLELTHAHCEADALITSDEAAVHVARPGAGPVRLRAANLAQLVEALGQQLTHLGGQTLGEPKEKSAVNPLCNPSAPPILSPATVKPPVKTQAVGQETGGTLVKSIEMASGKRARRD